MSESASLRSESVRELRRISEKEKCLAREAWHQVERDYEKYGVLVFQDLFAAHPSYKRFFIDVLDAQEDPFNNARFVRHMLQVLMPTVGGVIAHLDCPDAVHEAMKRLGVLHRKREFGLRRENVDVLGHVVLATLKRKLPNYTEPQEQALTKVMAIVINMFSNGLEGKTG